MNADRRRAGWPGMGPALRSAALRAVLCILLPAAAGQRPGTPALRTAHLIVLSSSSVMRSVNRNEGIAAGKVWLDSIARRRGFQLLESRFEVADTQEELRNRVNEGSVGVVVLDVIEYLSLPRPELLNPILMTGTGEMQRRLLLVVPSANGSSSIEDLRGKRISYITRSNADLGRKWLEVMLQERHLGRVDRFFGSFTAALKPSAACLPVFFGKQDGCVIDQPSFALLKEMNPQMAAKLQVIATSPAYPEYFIGVHVNHHEFRDELLRGLLELNQDAEGRQLLMVFKGDRVMPVPSNQLNAVRELWTKYRKIDEPQAHEGATKSAGFQPALATAGAQ